MMQSDDIIVKRRFCLGVPISNKYVSVFRYGVAQLVVTPLQQQNLWERG